MIYPRPLFKGARVGVISPAGSINRDPEKRKEIIEKCRVVMEGYGFTPVFYPSCDSAYGYLAGDDALRAKDVMDAFRDDTIDGIWCIRGGYGVQRLLDLLDFEEIERHPKWLGGYSDITALHIMLNQRCGMVSFHTPMPSTELIVSEHSKGLDEYSEEWLQKALFTVMSGELPSKTPVTALFSPGEKTNGSPSSASGRLVGGNLSLVSSSLGTPYEIDTKSKILFLEDVNESPYRIDGMLNHLRLAGKLEDAAGILLGYWTGCDVAEEDRGKAMDLYTVFRDLLPKDKPVLMGYSCGHERPTASLPLGAEVTLSEETLTLTVTGK